MVTNGFCYYYDMSPFDLTSLELKIVSARDISTLIEESRYAFSPPSTNPDEDSRALFDFFERRHESGKDVRYQPLAYVLHGRPISYIVALSYKNNAIAIGPMYVAQDFRGYGVGAKQVTDFIKYANRHRFDGIFTKTWGKNGASQAIFAKNGFETIVMKPGDRADGDATIKYFLKL